MPAPVTVFYPDGRVVRSVYPDQIPAHLADGGSLSPIAVSAIATEPTPEPTPESNLHSLSWKQLKEIADSLGLHKPDDISWKDFIPEIESAQ